jgi:hypothetical protein
MVVLIVTAETQRSSRKEAEAEQEDVDEDEEHQEKNTRRKKEHTYIRKKRDRFLCYAAWSLFLKDTKKRKEYRNL